MLPEIIDRAQAYLYQISSAVIILLGGLVLGILARKLLLRLFEEVKLNKLAMKIRNGYDLESIISNLTAYLIYFLAIVLFLDSLGLRVLAIYLLIVIMIILFALSSLVGIRDFLPNLLGRIYLKQKGLVKLGKTIEIENIGGKIEKIGLLETIVRTEKGDRLYLSNSLFHGEKVRVR